MSPAGPKKDTLKQGDSRNVTLWRTFGEIPSDSFTFTVDDNFGNRVPVEVTGASDLPSLSKMAESLTKSVGRMPTVEDALKFVARKNQTVSAGSYVTAAAILSSAGNPGGALEAIQTAERINPQIKTDGNIQLESGILHLESDDTKEALGPFRIAASASDQRIADTARFYLGVTLLKSRQSDEAASYICGEKGSAYPDPERTKAVLGSEIRDLEQAQTSSDCRMKVARIRPDIRNVPNREYLEKLPKDRLEERN